MTAAKAPQIDNQASGGKGFMLLVLAILVAGLAFVAYFVTSRETAPSGDATAPVEVDGDPLPAYDGEGVSLDPASDAAIGQQLPAMSGTNFSDKEVKIEDDGRAKAIYFLAHWCPHCAAELPKLVELMNEGALPDDVDIYAVNTAYDPGQGNPPSRWYYNENYDGPVLRDDADNTLFNAAGGRGFPYALYVDANNTVVARTSGEIADATIKTLWETLVIDASAQ